MHIACNNTGWYATAADKLLFHTLLTGAGLPTPTLLAVTGPERRLPHSQLLRDEPAIVAFLRDTDNYPLFGKPIDGKYSISVVSADAMTGMQTKSSFRVAKPYHQRRSRER